MTDGQTAQFDKLAIWGWGLIKSTSIWTRKHLKQAIVEGEDPNRTPTVSEFSCLDIKHVRSLLRGLSHNVFLTTFFTQRLSHIVFLTPLPLHIRPHNVVLTTSRYLGYFFGCINTYPKINQIRLSSDPRNFDNFWSIKLKRRRCTSAIFLHYAKFQNPTTKASNQSVAEKVLYKYPKISSYSCKFRPPQFRKFVVDQTETSTLHICNI